jgi:hypothetical protein
MPAKPTHKATRRNPRALSYAQIQDREQGIQERDKNTSGRYTTKRARMKRVAQHWLLQGQAASSWSEPFTCAKGA